MLVLSVLNNNLQSRILIDIVKSLKPTILCNGVLSIIAWVPMLFVLVSSVFSNTWGTLGTALAPKGSVSGRLIIFSEKSWSDIPKNLSYYTVKFCIVIWEQNKPFHLFHIIAFGNGKLQTLHVGFSVVVIILDNVRTQICQAAFSLVFWQIVFYYFVLTFGAQDVKSANK